MGVGSGCSFDRTVRELKDVSLWYLPVVQAEEMAMSEVDMEGQTSVFEPQLESKKLEGRG